MFAYCLNNPVIFADSTGKFCVDWDINPRPTIGEKLAEWFLKTDEDERNDDNELTPGAKVKRFFMLLWDNIEFSCGAGMGYELSANLFELVEIGAGMHGDLICTHLENGELSYGQEYNAGLSITLFFQNFGYVETIYNEAFKAGTLEANKGFWGDESGTIASASVYIGVGGHIRLGFDVVTFCQEWNKTFR